MKPALATLTTLLLINTNTAAAADEPDNGIPIEQIIATVAHKANRRFLVDPRVDARVGTQYKPETCEPSKRSDS